MTIRATQKNKMSWLLKTKLAIVSDIVDGIAEYQQIDKHNTQINLIKEGEKKVLLKLTYPVSRTVAG